MNNYVNFRKQVDAFSAIYNDFLKNIGNQIPNNKIPWVFGGLELSYRA